MSDSALLLPGTELPPALLPQSKKGTLTLGPGLRHIPPASISTTITGTLAVDAKKSALWLEPAHAGGRYQPTVGDLVVAQIHHSSADTFHCTLTPHTTPALLPQLAFEGVNKKTRPSLQAGDLVYARVARASPWEDTEVECVYAATGKGAGLGPLKGGMVFEVSPTFARRLMMGNDKEGRSKGGVVVLEELGKKVKFEVAVGRNGRVWVDSGSVRETIMIGRTLGEADVGMWDEETQRKAVKKALKDVSG